MELKGSLLYSQNSDIRPYPEPIKFNTQLHTPSLTRFISQGNSVY